MQPQDTPSHKRSKLPSSCVSCGRSFCARGGHRFCSQQCWQNYRTRLVMERLADEQLADKRTCKVCELDQPLRAFHLDGEGRRRTECRSCRSLRGKQRYQDDPEPMRSWSRSFRQRHPDRCRAIERRWRASHRTTVLAASRRYYQEHREYFLEHARRQYQRLKAEWACGGTRPSQSPTQIARRRAYYERNKERHAQYRQAWAESHRHLEAETSQRRRARKRGARVEAVDREAIVQRDGSTCYLCGNGLRPSQVTLDHVVALTRGGPHSQDNLRVACRSCNSSKGTMDLATFLARRR